MRGDKPIPPGRTPCPAACWARAWAPAISVAQFLPTVQSPTDVLPGAGYRLILGQTGYEHAHEEALIDTLISRRLDGMFFTGLVHSPPA